MIVQRSPLKRVNDLPLDEFFVVLFVEVHVMGDGKQLGRFHVAELTLITVRARSTLIQLALFYCVAVSLLVLICSRIVSCARCSCAEASGLTVGLREGEKSMRAAEVGVTAGSCWWLGDF